MPSSDEHYANLAYTGALDALDQLKNKRREFVISGIGRDVAYLFGGAPDTRFSVTPAEAAVAQHLYDALADEMTPRRDRAFQDLDAREAKIPGDPAQRTRSETLEAQFIASGREAAQNHVFVELNDEQLSAVRTVMKYLSDYFGAKGQDASQQQPTGRQQDAHLATAVRHGIV